jgi:hypothetical protein
MLKSRKGGPTCIDPAGRDFFRVSSYPLSARTANLSTPGGDSRDVRRAKKYLLAR